MRLHFSLLPILACALARTSEAQTASCQVAKLPRVPEQEQLWGWAVATSRNKVLVGAPNVTDFGTDGAAFLFGLSSYIHEAALAPPDAGPESEIGNGVAISADGDRVFVAAPRDQHEGLVDGSVFVFERDSTGDWRQAATIIANQADPDPWRNELFGEAMCVNGDRILIGAYLDNAAYIFDRDADGFWMQSARLTGSPATGYLGYSVALLGDTAVAGAPNDFSVGWGSGAAFVFQRQSDGTWAQVQRLLPSPGDRLGFGRAVGISENTIFVGAPMDGTQAPNAGTVYVYARDGSGTWVESQRLYAPYPANSDVFGTSITVDESRALIGAENYSNHTPIHLGAAFLYERGVDGDWELSSLLMADDPHELSRFGRVVALRGNLAVVGAPYQSEVDEEGNPLPLAGAAYVFAVGPDENDNGVMDICECLARGDLDLDGEIAISDLSILLSGFGVTAAGDLDRDGDTDLQDLANLLSNWALRCQ